VGGRAQSAQVVELDSVRSATEIALSAVQSLLPELEYAQPEELPGSPKLTLAVQRRVQLEQLVGLEQSELQLEVALWPQAHLVRAA
jgi:hypothetical protein